MQVKIGFGFMLLVIIVLSVLLVRSNMRRKKLEQELTTVTGVAGAALKAA